MDSTLTFILPELKKALATLADMPVPIKQGLDRTMRALGNDASILLKKIYALKEHGRSDARERRVTRAELGNSITAMSVGRGSIEWQRRTDGKWEVAKVVDVPGVRQGTVYLEDLSNAPFIIQKGAVGYIYVDPTTGDLVDMGSLLKSRQRSDGAK